MGELADILVEKEFFIVFLQYIVEVVEELFQQLHSQALTQNNDVSEIIPIQYPTRWNLKGLLTSKYHRMVVRERCLESTLP